MEKHSRRNAIALMAGAVPALAATSSIAMAAQQPSPTPLFLEIVAAHSPAQAAMREWGSYVPFTAEWEAAEERSRAADEIYHGMIRRYIAEAKPNPTWHHVGELAAIQRHEWWDEDGRIGEPTDPWIERALMDLIEKVSGVPQTSFK